MLWDPLSSQNTWSPSRKGAQVSALARLEASEDEPEAELSQERDPEPKLDGLGGKAKAAAGAGSAGNRAFVGHQLCERPPLSVHCCPEPHAGHLSLQQGHVFLSRGRV